MESYLPTLLVGFFVTSNIVIFLKLYQSILKYLSPSKGYAFSFLTILGLLAFDYSVYSYTLQREITPRDQHYMKVQIENALNRLAGEQIEKAEKEKIVEDITNMFDQNFNTVHVRAKDASQPVALPERLDIHKYTNHLKLTEVENIIKINHITFTKRGKVKYIEVLM
jgi:hypothetical protein